MLGEETITFITGIYGLMVWILTVRLLARVENPYVHSWRSPLKDHDLFLALLLALRIVFNKPSFELKKSFIIQAALVF